MNSPYGLNAECLACHSQPDNFFCALSAESRKSFDQVRHASVLPRGAVIVVQGESPRRIFMLCQGQVKLSTASHDGKSFILRIANTGEVIGMDAVVTGMPFAFTAETMQPSRLNFVSREDFLHFLKGHGDAALRAAQQLSHHCHEAYDVVRSIGLSHSASGRVAKFLLAAATDGSVTRGVLHAQLALTHEEISQLLGTSRETITRTLAEFRRKDIAHLKGATLTIHNKPALERLVAA